MRNRARYVAHLLPLLSQSFFELRDLRDPQCVMINKFLSTEITAHYCIPTDLRKEALKGKTTVGNTIMIHLQKIHSFLSNQRILSAAVRNICIHRCTNAKMIRSAAFSVRGHCENLSLEYTISKALSNYAELYFKDKGQSIVSQPSKCLKFMTFQEGCFVIRG